MKLNADFGLILFGIISIIGTAITGDVPMLNTTQRIGFVLSVFGIMGACIYAGWVFRIEQPDLKQINKEVNK